MIVLNLKCHHDHQFEGWFASAAAFTDQQEAGLVVCPVCASVDVTKMPSCPHLHSSSEPANAEEFSAAAYLPAARRDVLAALYHSLKDVVRRSENVGDQFAEEARRIHYREAPLRNIRGLTTAEEARELIEEGISVLPLPFPAPEEVN